MPNQVSPRSPLASLHLSDISIKGEMLALEERPLGRLWQIAGWDDFAATSLPVLNVLGFSELGDYRQVQESAAALCYRVAPDKIWLRAVAAVGTAEDGGDALDAAVKRGDAERLAVLPMSHSRCVISVRGAACEDLMARVASLDFSVAAFPKGSFAQTGIHQAGVLIHRVQQDEFELVVPVSWAVSTWEWLHINASPYMR